MTRKKKIIVVLSAASVILVWRVSAVMTKYFPASAAAQPTAGESVAQTPIAPTVSVEEDKIDWKAQRLVETQPWGRNPFDLETSYQRKAKPEAARPEVVKTPPPAPQTQMRLTGVSRSGEQWLAAVGGRIMRVGDKLEERFKVTEITNSSVTLECQGWAFVYSLGSQEPVIRPVGERP
jgi:hypothetical protein